MRYFTTINHLADDNFVFQQDNALVHHACNTVKLLERELSSSNSLFSTMDLPSAAHTHIIFWDSYALHWRI